MTSDDKRALGIIVRSIVAGMLVHFQFYGIAAGYAMIMILGALEDVS